MSSRSYHRQISSTNSLLHEHDPTMDSRIVHAVNVSNKKELSQLKHKTKSLAGSREVAMHIYRQEEKELVKHLFKLQHEKERRHPEIDSARRHSLRSPDIPDSEHFIKSVDMHHGGSPTNQKPAMSMGSNTSLLEHYIKDPIYQPVGYGHSSQEYVGVPPDTTERRKHSLPDGKFGGSHTTSQTALSHPAIANALPSRHQINVQPEQQLCKTIASLDSSSLIKDSPKGIVEEEKGRLGSPVSSKQTVDLSEKHGAADSKPKAQPKQKMVMFDVKSSQHSSPVSQGEEPKQPQETTGAYSEESSLISASAAAPTSSMECTYDDQYETNEERRQSITKALIDQEHHKLDDVMESFRKHFPVQKELYWQKIHPRQAPQRGPFVAHTPPDHVASQDLSSEEEMDRIRRHDPHGRSYYDVEHTGTRNSHGRSHHAPNGSHASFGHHHHHHQPGTHGTPNGTPQGSYGNVSRDHFHKSHAKIDPHLSSGSHNSVGAMGLYNLPKEALEDYRNLMQHASHAAHHPSTRESHILPHHRHSEIPHSHPPKAQMRKARQKLLALHLLANQQRQSNATREFTSLTKLDPRETLMCRYLRLSAMNVETLVDMCNEAGVPIGIHPHMSIDDVADFVFKEKLLDNNIPGKDTASDLSKETTSHHEQEQSMDKTDSSQSAI